MVSPGAAMKRRRDAEDSGDPIPVDLEVEILTRLPAKFLVKPHQKKLLFHGGGKELEDDEKVRIRKVNPIPVDLEVEILTRLPAKSLMKFRCVSKMWSSIIRSQRFVDSYSAMASTMRSQFIITFGCVYADNDAKRLFIFSSSYENDDSSSLVVNLDMKITPVFLNECYSKGSSVHGFVGCPNGSQFIVCNPNTGQVITLPTKGCPTYLGYDPVENQFKTFDRVRNYISFQEYEVTTLGGKESPWRRNKVTSPPFILLTKDVCINGFVYWAAWEPSQRTNPVIVCFDVRFERFSFIKAPKDVVRWESGSILIEYKGKVSSIVRNPFAPFLTFDLWILEDVKKQDWSRQTFVLPFSLGMGRDMTSPGTNNAGEIIFSPTSRSPDIMVKPLYIFYYNVERKDIRRVRLRGIADDEEFRRHYGLTGSCVFSILPQHVQSIASL